MYVAVDTGIKRALFWNFCNSLPSLPCLVHLFSVPSGFSLFSNHVFELRSLFKKERMLIYSSNKTQILFIKIKLKTVFILLTVLTCDEVRLPISIHVFNYYN